MINCTSVVCTYVAVNGLDMFGLANEVVKFLLDRLPGIDNCPLYHHRYHHISAPTVPPKPEPEFAPVSISFSLFIKNSFALP